ncbi:hypothetical protein T484DRAFT_1777361 [Baffinella frigidus]|nr:hypothetical protein T484DRAFT_1777361 [Cryptophyta sp. CCMP2293]
MAFARRAPLFIVLLIASSATAFVAPLLSKLPPLRRGCALARPAAAGARHGSSALSATLLPLDSVGQWAGFFLWSVPLPLTIGAMLRAAEGNSPTPASLAPN